MNGDFGQHLPVQLHAGFFQTIHERTVIDAVRAAGRRNPGDPQAAEIALFLLAADKSVITGFHNLLFCHFKELALGAKIALGKPQRLFPSFTGHHCALNTLSLIHI